MNRAYYRCAVIIITHNRITDAQINMSLIRSLWAQTKGFSSIDIFHIYNGIKSKYNKKYLEDVLIYRKMLGHYFGAADMIDEGIRVVLSSMKKYDYILVLSGDVWITRPQAIIETLNEMKSKSYQLATSLWPNIVFIPKYFSTELFIITPEFARKIFPLNLQFFFLKKYFHLLLYKVTEHIPVITVPLVELCFTAKILKALKVNFMGFKWVKSIYLFPNRKIVWAGNRHHTAQLGYYSHHNISKKINLIKREYPSIFNIKEVAIWVRNHS